MFYSQCWIALKVVFSYVQYSLNRFITLDKQSIRCSFQYFPKDEVA